MHSDWVLQGCEALGTNDCPWDNGSDGTMMHLARTLKRRPGSLRMEDVGEPECFKTSGSSSLLCLILLHTVDSGN